MRNNRIINWIATGVSLAALATIYLDGSGNLTPARDSKLYAAVGDVMARQAISLLKPGGQVVVIVRDTKSFEHPATDDQLEQFTKTLKKANVPIARTLSLKVDPLRVLEVPSGDFYELIRKTDVKNVIVSFMGPPILSDDQIRKLPLQSPAIVAFCPGCLTARADLRALFEQKLLHAAVVSNPDAAATASSPNGSFENSYIEVTADNATSKLPAAVGATRPK